MMLLIQIALYCLLFAFLVKCAARNSGLNCLYFYPKEYIEEAQKRGLADKDATMKKGKRFMIFFCIVIFIALVMIIAVWNQVTDFKKAYLQAYLFLVVMNWFDGIVIDRLWVGDGAVSGYCACGGRYCGVDREDLMDLPRDILLMSSILL